MGSLVDLEARANGDLVPIAYYDEHIASLCVALAQSERSCAAYRRRMNSSSTESIDLHQRLPATEKKATVYQANELKSTDLIASMQNLSIPWSIQSLNLTSFAMIFWLHKSVLC